MIKKILLKQGISLQKLSKLTNISSWLLCKGKNNLSHLNDKKIKMLRRLLNKKSLIIKNGKRKIIKIKNKKFIITKNILPNKSRNNFSLYCKEYNKTIKVWYQPKTRGKIEVILPKYIKLDKNFILGLGLSIGDGLNNPSKYNTHYNFSNTNLELTKIVYNWLKNYFKIKKNKIQIYAIKNRVIFEEEINQICKKLKIKKEKIRIYNYKRNKKLEVILQLSSPIFQCLYLNLLKNIQNIIIKNKNYRRAFLKALFAAEGHVKHSIYKTLESIIFSFNPKTEVKLAQFVKKCLKKEEINCKINNNGIIYFCSYEKMLKFYNLGLIELNKEKEDKFIKLYNHSIIYLYFKNNFIRKITKESQVKTSKKWNICQSSVSEYKKYNKLNIKLANKLFRKKELQKNIKYAKIGKSIVKNKESINLIIGNYMFTRIYSLIL